MTIPGRTPAPHAGLCWYGMQKLPGLLDAFTCEIDGVREAQDIEYIHRMRVASRRLRAALPLFRPCFPEKQYLKWMQEITRITRALGEARDADVQIAFLQKSLKKIQKDAGAHEGRETGTEHMEEPAIRFLLAALQKKRRVLQKHVHSALAGLEKSRVTGEMQAVFSSMNADFQAARKKPPLQGIPMTAALRISRRLSALLSYEPWVLHPEAVAEHHATRIAAKKLRYTMEVYGSLYRNNLHMQLARVKKVQEILGDIHDCDVWIDHITSILMTERTRLRSAKGAGRPDTRTLSSLRSLLRNRETERSRRYRHFVRFWQSLARVHFWDGIRTSLDTGRKTAFRPMAPRNEESAAEAADALAGTDPEICAHSRHVTDLALMLFDQLQPLHGLGMRDRFLIRIAGALHDTGTSGGTRGHHRRGAEMVFCNELLWFDLEERAILAVMVFAHRGKVRLPSCPYLTFLRPESRKRALMLAAILRVADGLDYPHAGSARRIRCSIAPEAVTCTVTGTGDLSVEKERAQGKSDLFSQVSGKVMVIR